MHFIPVFLSLTLAYRYLMEMEYAAAAVDAAAAVAVTSSGAAVLAAVHEDEEKWPEAKHLHTAHTN